MAEEQNPYLSPQTPQRRGSIEPVPLEKPHEPLINNMLGSVVGFCIGVLGNLVAGWLQQEWLNPFTRPLLAVIALLTVAGLGASIWLSRRPLLVPKLPGIKNQRLARSLVLVLIAMPITVAFSSMILASFAGARDCSEVKVKYLELYLGEPKYPLEDKVFELEPVEILNKGNLSGRVVFSNPAVANHCACEWWGETDRIARQRLTETKEARDSSFSIPLQNGVKEITLTLTVGKQVPPSEFRPAKSFNFNIKVQPKTRLQ